METRYDSREKEGQGTDPSDSDGLQGVREDINAHSMNVFTQGEDMKRNTLEFGYATVIVCAHTCLMFSQTRQ
jgi:hypothetical protein